MLQGVQLFCSCEQHLIVYVFQVEEILGNPATSGKGGVYYYSERGDRLIDLASLRDKLWQVGFLN